MNRIKAGWKKAVVWSLISLSGSVLQAEVVAYYTFDSNTLDSTANKYDGQPTNLTYSASVPSALGSGKSLYWGDESVQRYVNLPVVRGLGSNFSITCWAKTPNNYTNSSGTTCIMASSTPLAPGFDCWLNSWNSNNRRLGMSTRNASMLSDGASTGDGAFSDNVWHHLAFIRNGTNCTIFVDGTPVSLLDGTVRGDFPVNGALRIGHNFQTGGGNNWAGYLDDFAIWDEALDTSRISGLASGTVSPADYMQTPARVIAYYPFNDSAADASGLGYDASMVNVSYSTDVPSAIGSGKSANWVGGTGQRYVSVPSLLELATEFSATCWAKLPAGYSNPGGGTTLLANAVPGKPGFQFYLNSWSSNDRRLTLASNNERLENNNATSSTNVFSDGIWHHVALIRAGTNAVFYVDGTRVPMPDTSVLADFSVNLPMRIGQNFQAGANNLWGGQIDDFTIWNGVLSTNVIVALAGGTDSPTNHLVPSWWTNQYVTEMDGFYRYQTMCDAWLKGGGALLTVPAYMTSASDFPYVKRDFAEEGFFTDEFILVRALGGWLTNSAVGEAAETHTHIKEFDVAYKTNNTWAYRWPKLFDRIDPYYSNGYDRITMVLDNICWDFPTAPAEYAYGQAEPPADMDIWQSFMTNLCGQLAGRYGTNTVSRWQFRVGTETHASVRFHGTGAEHDSFYDHTAAAVTSRFPSACIGPGNFFDIDDQRVYSGGWLEFINHCADGTNYVSGTVGSRYSFTCRSLYKGAEFWNPDDAVSTYFEETADIDAMLGYSVSREVHEYSILKNELGQDAGEQGVWGAVWHMQTLMGLYASGVSKIQHWGLTENVSGKTALSGQGWVYMILDHLRGGELYELQHPTNSAAGTQYRTYAIDKGSAKYIFLSAFNTNRTANDTRTITINVPRDMLPVSETSQIRYTALTETNSIYDMIRTDLAANGLLLTPWSANAETISSVNAMGGTTGKTYVANNWSTYEQAFTNSLTLGSFPGTLVRNATNNVFSVQVANPSIHVIAIKN